MKYYSTERPIAPGTYPHRELVESIENFEQKKFCADIGREAWGVITYKEAIPDQDANNYELILEGMHQYWSVTSTFDNKGRVTSAITSVIEATTKPENIYHDTPQKDIYIDWFDNKADAEKHVADAKLA